MLEESRLPGPPAKVAAWGQLKGREPVHALVANVELVVIRYDQEVSVLYGRCLHRGALMADGHADGHNLVCGVHQWDYRLASGVSEYDKTEALNGLASKSFPLNWPGLRSLMTKRWGRTWPSVPVLRSL